MFQFRLSRETNRYVCIYLYLVINLSGPKFVKILYVVAYSLASRIVYVFKKYGSVNLVRQCS